MEGPGASEIKEVGTSFRRDSSVHVTSPTQVAALTCAQGALRPNTSYWLDLTHILNIPQFLSLCRVSCIAGSYPLVLAGRLLLSTLFKPSAAPAGDFVDREPESGFFDTPQLDRHTLDRHTMVGLVSAAGLVGFLSEPDTELKVFALKTLDNQVDSLWTEIAGSVGQM
jgi:hypothetical protein